MVDLVQTSRFRKDLKKAIKRGKDLSMLFPALARMTDWGK